MNINTAKFLISAVAQEHFPKPVMPEFAFIGRSNVGKSSLINMLTGRKLLAKISSTPGKTRTLNFFSINEQWMLVDMPGYGYAKLSKTQRQKFYAMIADYFQKRNSLTCAFVLIDSRHAPLQSDIDFITYLGELGVPFAIVFTKTDKLSKKQLTDNQDIYKTEVLKYFETMPPFFSASSLKGVGREDVLAFIENAIAGCK
jgi:GTP-binding protein